MNTPPTVLVAEDSQTQATRIRHLLEQAGFEVTHAANGRAALDRIRESPPEMIVTDLDMPELNGLELVEAVRQGFPQTPVVLITDRGSEEIASEALQKGAASYVPKRFLKELVPTLQRLLAVARADRASTQLAACATYSEMQYCLTNNSRLVGPLVAQMVRMIERFGIRDNSGAMRAASALDEAIQNAFVHGNLEVSSKLREEEDSSKFYTLVKQRRLESPYKDRRTWVRGRVTPDSAEFVIRDEGPGFDPATIPDPTDPANLGRPCGRGLWLIHAFMDEVRHNASGNEITMILRRRD